MRNILAIEVDAAGVWPSQSGDEVEQCGFAGAVRPDDAERFAARNFKRDVIDGLSEPTISSDYPASGSRDSRPDERRPAGRRLSLFTRIISRDRM